MTWDYKDLASDPDFPSAGPFIFPSLLTFPVCPALQKVSDTEKIYPYSWKRVAIWSMTGNTAGSQEDRWKDEACGGLKKHSASFG